ncbi:MAG: phosphotransferase [Proteobacteria bacterium]|nr:phosphotransferase [Pseudomonadota bacterium]
MSQLSDLYILQCALGLMLDCGMVSSGEAQGLLSKNHCQKICSDGSTRKFWRVLRAGKALCIIAAPAGRSNAELAESRSAWNIGKHLIVKGVPVPELFGWNEENGILLFEDLGDVRLHDIIRGPEGISRQGGTAGRDFYRAALSQLANMQLAGAEDFVLTWCWDSPRYDIPLMVERESGYFLRAFWQGLLGQEDNGGVEEEFRDIAEVAGKARADFFLHRDFQSRNIMVKDGSVRFIDFQGGRLGPLGYDVASLLIDPYAALTSQVQEELLDYYVSLIAARLPGSEKDFHKYFSFLALQRNLQIVGAFAFLSKIRGKPFFTTFIQPALLSLRERLANSSFSEYHRLRALVDRGLELAAT